MTQDPVQLAHQTWQAGHLEAALGLLDRVLEAQPDHPAALHLYGVIDAVRGDLARAEKSLRRAYTLMPQNEAIRLNLFRVLARLGAWQEADGLIDSSVTLQQAAAIAAELGNTPVAYQYAMRIADEDAEPWFLVMRVRVALKANRFARALAWAEFGLERLGDEDELFLLLVEAKFRLGEYADVVDAHHQRLERMQTPSAEQLSRAQLMATHLVRYDGLQLNALNQRLTALYRSPGPSLARSVVGEDPEKTLRVAFLARETLSGLGVPQLQGFVRALNRQPKISVEVFDVYPAQVQQKHVTPYQEDEIAVYALGQADADGIARRIADGAYDVLLDHGGHAMDGAVYAAARRPAPVMVSTAFAPTGVEVEALYLYDAEVSAGWATANPDAHLWRHLPIWGPYEHRERRGRSLVPPSQTSGYITFGAFGNVSKVTDETLILWGRVLQQLPTSRLLFKSIGIGDKEGAERVWVRMQRAGVPMERVKFLSWINAQETYERLYELVDIMLDSYPFCGASTSFAALAEGVPVITRVGTMPYARMSLSCLNAVGLQTLAAGDDDEFVRIAVALAEDDGRLSQLRRELPRRLRTGPASAFEQYGRSIAQAIRTCWRNVVVNSRTAI